ncbi:MAG: bifunctional 2-C-methyl-D-erythritol 4-phosphate cytidylyltransferase/2-C-methyl-D-erythritol 2,4-cyclodiphosphate synthase [Alphaproteobacteria bacterium]|nr:MAG: bifunctional 2-C-methyl-D-erythritol 4-phosphate cytidylyltransferase/2-C-methyl-D-erythritol 2,4-cyclodiphosphate synthase [Alphaproteobacteria bacterium]
MNTSAAPSSQCTAVVIVAGGMGLRAGGDTPKQYQRLGSGSVLGMAAEVFLAHPNIDLVQIVIGADDRALYEGLNLSHEKLLEPVIGGDTRQASVYEGLKALQPHMPDQVLIHDGARPFLTSALVSKLLEALEAADGAFLAVPVADTLRRRNEQTAALETIDRRDLWQAQTPQGFSYPKILRAHQSASGHETDDVALAEQAGLKIKLVEGSRRNFKITTAADLEMAQHLTQETATLPALQQRVGFGYDVHRFEPGDGLMLCGVHVPHSHKLRGHSDADVGLHALTDALLGAIGDGDIGTHFPPSEDQWKDVSSDVFLEHAGQLIQSRGGQIINVDVTLICEAPKIGPYREAMRARLAEILQIPIDAVSVKATTTERLGFTGRGEGIAAQAVACVALKSKDKP